MERSSIADDGNPRSTGESSFGAQGGIAPSPASGAALSADDGLHSRQWNTVGLNVRDSLKRAIEVCEAAFDAIVDKSADAMIVVDRQGTICFANSAADSLLGRSTGELLGETFRIPVIPGTTSEVDFLKEDAPTRIAEMRVVETRWQGNPAFLATFRDVTERKLAEEKAREAIRRRDEFLAILSHELRNPLAAISNAAAVLGVAEIDGATFKRAQAVIERQCRQMTRLLEDLLDVSRVTRRKIELRKECVDLAEVIAETVDAMRQNIDAAGQTLSVQIAANPIAVDADPVRMQQILVNLLSNASKFSRAGDRIELSAAIEEREAVIRVRDQGLGMSPDLLEAIFEPFVQSGPSLDRPEGGLGLGLAIVDGLVRLHGGSVRASSPGIGKGSEFCVRLPPAASQPKSQPPRAAISAIESLRILIVEDNADVRVMLCTLLECAGHDVEVAEDGMRGVEMIEFQHPDVALIDIGLPGISGYDVAQKVRANPNCHDVFLVALTGYSQRSDQEKALAVGFDAHLAKPVDFDRLQRILARLARPKRLI